MSLMAYILYVAVKRLISPRESVPLLFFLLVIVAWEKWNNGFSSACEGRLLFVLFVWCTFFPVGEKVHSFCMMY